MASVREEVEALFAFLSPAEVSMQRASEEATRNLDAMSVPLQVAAVHLRMARSALGECLRLAASPHACGQVECLNVAAHTMLWPGRPPQFICAEHKQKAEQVAEAMGFTLHFEEVE